MYSVTKEIHFCYGHRLLNYEGKCKYLHGHNGRVQVELRSEKLDKREMVFDFSDISRVIKSWVDETLDHTLILCEKDPLVPMLREKKERFFVIETNPTAEAIAKLIYEYTVSQGFPVHAVTLWETESSFATYRGCA
ncbi:MAG: 6-carboxytetrahydropterin synthase [Candidatus Omnitrophica bacterium]|nr:6-carboxytetrahydropterin synthase [Candidatus Omnitrophota bacterium]